MAKPYFSNPYRSLSMKKSLTLVLAICSLAAPTTAQLTVNTGAGVNQLVQNVLLGGGVTATNVTYTGGATARASFTAVNSNLGLSAGVILSSGNATSAAQPASNFSGDSPSNTTDPDLVALSGQSINNASVLQFDFIPTGDTLRFRYVFASEEYNGFVCSQFNDAFGFFLSGPGFNGPFSNNAVNIAVVPGTNVPITINTVNSGVPSGFNSPSVCAASDPNWQSNSVYYVDNQFGTTVVYDGFTTVLTAFALVQCGQTYHIKLAIGDAVDTSYDSAVFLEAGSFTSTGQVEPALVNGLGVDGTTMMEGCGPYQLVFTRVGELDEDATVSLSTGGTATPGVDYNPPIPTEIYFPAGVETVTLFLDVPLDADGPETIVIDVEQLIECANVVVETSFTFTIDSYAPLNVGLNDINSVCNQVNVLAPSVTGGPGQYTYLWNTGETTSTISVSPGVTTTYSVTVSDVCGVEPVTEDVTVTLPIYPPLEIEVSPPTQIPCLELGPISVTSATGGNNQFTYLWTLNGQVIGNTATVNVPGGSPTWYVVTVTEGCGTSVQDSVLVSAVPLDPIVITATPDPTVICTGDTAHLEIFGITGGNGVYTVSWTNANGVVLSNGYSIDVAVPTDHVYTITATDQCGNQGVLPITTYIPHYAPFVLTMPADSTLCAGESITLQALVTGGSGYYYIEWHDLGHTDPVLEVAPMSETVYTVTVTDECGEQITGTTTIDVEHVHTEIVVTNRGQDDWYLQAATLPYARTWVWDMGDGTRYRGDEVHHSYLDLEEHWVTLLITTPNGCVGMDSVLLRPPAHIYFPNAFTPDGDGNNDTWGPVGHYIDEFELTIFDRWGSVVFTTTEFTKHWDGTVNGSSEPKTGVYVYKYRAVGHYFPAQEGYGHIILVAGSVDQ